MVFKSLNSIKLFMNLLSSLLYWLLMIGMHAALFLIFVIFCKILIDRHREIFIASIFLKTKSSASKKNSAAFTLGYFDFGVFPIELASPPGVLILRSTMLVKS